MKRSVRHKSKKEQADASNPRVSVWVSANAGSGKTRVLVDRIARLLLAGIAPDRLLCLTFTKAAAAEMKNRLFDELGNWATLPDVDLKQDLGNLMGTGELTDSLLETARRLFAQALETPGGMKVQTIHAFCEALLKRFPLEAGLPPLFEVADERAVDELLGLALGRTLEDLDAPGDVALRRLATKVGADELRLRILDYRKVQSRAELAGTALVHGAAARALGLGNQMDAAQLRRQIADVPDRDVLAENVGYLRGLSKKMVDLGDAMDGQLSRVAIDPDAWIRIFLTQKMRPIKEIVTKAVKEDLAETLRQEQSRVVELFQKVIAADLAEDTDALFLLGDRTLVTYEALKRERTILDFDDLIGAAQSLLTRADMSQWVLFKIDGGVDHILVDEAQDTSPAQWNIIEAIAEEFFVGETRRTENRTFFAVGDEKQSIYSFQGADPAAVADTRDKFRNRAHDAQRDWIDPKLTTSFRSAPAILGFVDKVFQHSAASEGLIFDGSTVVEHLAERHQVPGQVELWPPCESDITEDDEIWTRPPDAEPVQSGRTRLVRMIAGQIRTWLDDGKMLPDGSEPVRPGHILILMRRRAQFMDLLNRELKRVGIPVAGVDRMAPIQEMPVMDLMVLAEFALQPLDDLTLATVLKGPLIGWDDAALMDAAIDRRDNLWTSLQTEAKSNARVAEAVTVLMHVLARADRTPPFEFFMDLLDARGLRRAFHGQLGPAVDDPIDEFLNQALAYERLEAPSLRGFLYWIGGSTAEIKRELDQSRDEVRLMTVHGAKGLESKIVILPDTTDLPNPQHLDNLLPVGDPQTYVWRGKKDAEPAALGVAREAAEADQNREYRRLLYVALTRAEDWLIVCGALNKKQSTPVEDGGIRGPAEHSWYDLVERAMAELKPVVEGEALIYRIGDKTAKLKDRAGSRTVLPSLPKWASTDPLPEPARLAPVSPSRLGDREPGPGTPVVDGAWMRARGNAVHRLLEILPEQPARQRADLARAMLARQEWAIPQGEVEGLIAETLAVLDHSQFAPIFAPGSHAEAAVAGPVQALGGRPVSGFIDRMAITESAVLIVDFKTNRQPPESAESVSEQYVNQMALYCAALSEIYPGRSVQAALLWTSLPNLMILPEALLDKAIHELLNAHPAS